MKIKDIKIKQKKLYLKGKVIEKSKIRNVDDMDVVNVLFDDGTGRADLCIYGKSAKEVGEGDTILVCNAMCTGRKEGLKKITTGKYGRIIIR